MIAKIEQCPQCGAETEVNSYRKFVVCPYCGGRYEFSGFTYKTMDPTDSMYAHVKYEQDCPACRSKHMLLMGRTWKCVDCGYQIPKWKKLTGVFWCCDCCETYMNIQPGFNTKSKVWKCTECGYVNDVSRKNIL